MIPHSCPDITEEEIDALTQSARSRQLKGADSVRLLESRIADDLGYQGGVAAVSGGHALHLLLRALFRGSPVRIGLPSYTCRSFYDAICLAGCRPVLLDIDPQYLSVSVEQASTATIDAVIVPHMFGIRAPVEQFQKKGLVVIEDCAQRLAPVVIAKTEPKGCYRILSLEATKLITCGEGGLLLANDAAVLKRAQQLRDASYELTEPAVGPCLTDLQAAMTLVQWQRLGDFLVKRRNVANRYISALQEIAHSSVVPAMLRPDTFHFRFLLNIDDPQALIDAAADKGVSFRRPVAPLALHKLFLSNGHFPATDLAMQRLVSVPLYPSLTAQSLEFVIKQLVGYFSTVVCVSSKKGRE
jgi:dTDP-4-amino-4,6-dideoxygalactose transaminase